MFLKKVADKLKEHAAQFDSKNRAIEGCKGNLHILSQVNFGRREENFPHIFGRYALETVEDDKINDDWFTWNRCAMRKGN